MVHLHSLFLASTPSPHHLLGLCLHTLAPSGFLPNNHNHRQLRNHEAGAAAH